jgi:hypothetical protein
MVPPVKRLLLFLSAVLVLASVVVPASASALTGPQRLTFSDYEEGEPISTQYEAQGVIFSEEDGFYPEIRWDGASYENPVLGGPFGFGSRIKAEFVQPGTTTSATVENLAMTIGDINDPGSVELTVEQSNGPFALWTNEYGFNHMYLGSNDVTGFTVETVGDEDAGWAIDNLEYTIPTPPPPPPPPAPAPAPAAPASTDTSACPTLTGPVWKKVLTLYSCKSMERGKCAVAVVMNFPDLKALKGADGLYDLSKVAKLNKGLVPAATLSNKLSSIKLLPGAPNGYKTAGQILGKLKTVKTAADIIRMLPDLKKAMNKTDFLVIYHLLVEFTGVQPCIDLVTSW